MVMLVVIPALVLKLFRAISIAAVVLFTPSFALASATELPAPTTASGEAYLKAIDGEDIDTSVVYYDPAKEGPVIDVRQDLAEDKRRSRQPGVPFSSDWTRVDILVMVICALIILVILWLVAKYGGAIRVSLDKTPDPGGRRGPHASSNPMAKTVMVPEDIASILAIKDRRRALGLLLRLALERAARANGLAVGRSQTARDILNVLPSASPLIPSLRDLVRQAEIVRFGGRPISEAAFRACVTIVEPIVEARPR